MSGEDRLRWDQRYGERDPVSVDHVGLPSAFQPYAEVFPTAGHALDLACGLGAAAVWLARRGLDVLGCDVSPVAIARARGLADAAGVSAHCRLEVVDLDDGLPTGPPVDVVVCTKFRDRRLDAPIVDRLAAGGLLAISACSEVDAASGPFRAAAGELVRAFGALEVIAEREGDGEAWLLARRADR